MSFPWADMDASSSGIDACHIIPLVEETPAGDDVDLRISFSSPAGSDGPRRETNVIRLPGDGKEEGLCIRCIWVTGADGPATVDEELTEIPGSGGIGFIGFRPGDIRFPAGGFGYGDGPDAVGFFLPGALDGLPSAQDDLFAVSGPPNHWRTV